MPQTALTAKLREAIAELHITTPVYRADLNAEGGLTIHLPHHVLHWKPKITDITPQPTTHNPQPLPIPPPSEENYGDFTAIPYVGNDVHVTLHEHGYFTFEALVRASDAALLQLPGVGPFVLSKIRTYLRSHYL